MDEKAWGSPTDRFTIKLKETDLKSQIKDYLALKGIFSWPVTQGLGTYRGAPDRIMHFKGRVVYLEIKLPKGKLSDWQQEFQELCREDEIQYYVIHSLEELQNIVG